MGLEGELRYLYGLESRGMVFGLENVSQLLDLLGNPHLRLRAVHVAGTNGKGSVCAMLHSILSHRFRVGLYTSPHLHRVNERIRVDREIEDGELLGLIRLLRKRVEEEGRPETFTFFDFTTALAFHYFAERQVDLAVVEVGLGGRLDSTNVLRPLVGVITNVGHDHMDVLGPTLEDVAREKAGIIKEGVPLVCGERKEGPLGVILHRARELGAEVLLLGRDFSYRWEGELLSFKGRRWELRGLKVGLLGRHQGENAALALAVLEVLEEMGYGVTEEEVRRGLQGVRWPGRLELFPGPPKVLLDGAHNPEGIEVLREAVSHIPHSALYLVMGVMADKDWKGMLDRILPLCRAAFAFRPNNPRSLPPERLCEEIRRRGWEAHEAPGAAEALQMALERASEDDLILCCGSLFAVAEVREVLVSARWRGSSY